MSVDGGRYKLCERDTWTTVSFLPLLQRPEIINLQGDRLLWICSIRHSHPCSVRWTLVLRPLMGMQDSSGPEHVAEKNHPMAEKPERKRWGHGSWEARPQWPEDSHLAHFLTVPSPPNGTRLRTRHLTHWPLGDSPGPKGSGNLCWRSHLLITTVIPRVIGEYYYSCCWSVDCYRIPWLLFPFLVKKIVLKDHR